MFNIVHSSCSVVIPSVDHRGERKHSCPNTDLGDVRTCECYQTIFFICLRVCLCEGGGGGGACMKGVIAIQHGSWWYSVVSLL